MANNNSTFVPGGGMSENFAGATNSFDQNPSNAYASPDAGTFVPGMQDAPVPNSVPEPVKSTTPVVGFLYSISNKGCTEYWPLHLGANIIGRGAGVDIQLNEATVSERHAQISVKRMKRDRRLIAHVQDIGSKTGMFLNDEELDFTGTPCKNLDVLQVGEAYTLLIVLIDTDAYGLQAAENFRPTASAQPEPVVPGFDDFGGSANIYDRNATIDLSGNGNVYEAPGGTQILE